MLPIFWINRDCDVDRAAFMQSQFDTMNTPASRISATVPKNVRKQLNGRTLKQVVNVGCGSSVTEIACTMSHVRAIQSAYDAGHDTAIICEDDADFAPFSVNKLRTTMATLPIGWDILQLYTLSLSALKVLSTCPEYTCIPHENFRNRRTQSLSGTQAYVINRCGMEKLLHNWNVHPFISGSGEPGTLNAEVFVYRQCNGYVASRPLVRHNVSLVSTIHPAHTEKYHKKAEVRIDQLFGDHQTL